MAHILRRKLPINIQERWEQYKATHQNYGRTDESVKSNRSNKKLTEAPDIFGIETDAEIVAEMDKRREAAWAKRREIIDGDMLGYVSNYAMLDKMATKKTLKDKKDFIVNYIMRDLPEVRKGPDFRGKQSFIYNSKYKDKPVDRAMAEKCADFILDKYKNEDGVRFYKDANGIIRDANGINVNETRYNNNNIKFKYREEIMHKKFPNIKYFHNLSKEQQEAVDMEAKELWLADDNYVEIVPLTDSGKCPKCDLGEERLDENKLVEEKPTPIMTPDETGISLILSNLIKDEWEAIDGYNSAIQTLADLKKDDAITILQDIVKEENVHVGQLEQLLKTFSVDAHDIDKGEQEAEEQLSK